MTTEDEAKQLDSVTDRVQVKELDESRATQALAGALSGTSSVGQTGGATTFIPKKEDVAVIVDELEVTEDEAVAALRSVAAERGEDGTQLVAAALRRLVRS